MLRFAQFLGESLCFTAQESILNGLVYNEVL
ncbi:Uncharacterized protein pbN1_00140 [Aromatoleum bremense]|nr:Uncharacterized protein pbN1_00140 [Aromatoleum bremense]